MTDDLIAIAALAERSLKIGAYEPDYTDADAVTMGAEAALVKTLEKIDEVGRHLIPAGLCDQKGIDRFKNTITDAVWEFQGHIVKKVTYRIEERTQ